MSVTEEDRLRLRERLNQVLGEREAAVLMESVPPVKYDELATKQDLALLRDELRVDTREIRAEMQEFRAEVGAEMREFRAELEGELREFRAEVGAETRELRADLGADMRELRVETRELRAELKADMAQQLRVTVLTHVGSMVGLAAFLSTFG